MRPKESVVMRQPMMLCCHFTNKLLLKWLGEKMMKIYGFSGTIGRRCLVVFVLLWESQNHFETFDVFTDCSQSNKLDFGFLMKA